MVHDARARLMHMLCQVAHEEPRLCQLIRQQKWPFMRDTFALLRLGPHTFDEVRQDAAGTAAGGSRLGCLCCQTCLHEHWHQQPASRRGATDVVSRHPGLSALAAARSCVIAGAHGAAGEHH